MPVRATEFGSKFGSRGARNVLGVAVPIGDRTSAELRGVLEKYADTRSALMTDEWSAYDRPGREFAGHNSVNHSVEEWTRWERGRMAGTRAV